MEYMILNHPEVDICTHRLQLSTYTEVAPLSILKTPSTVDFRLQMEFEKGARQIGHIKYHCYKLHLAR